MEVLECLWKGASNREISDVLNLSINTAKFHVSRLYTKLVCQKPQGARMVRKEKQAAFDSYGVRTKLVSWLSSLRRAARSSGDSCTTISS